VLLYQHFPPTLVIVCPVFRCFNELKLKQTQTNLKQHREEMKMKKSMKSKKGMTLVEIVTVIAIIVILASVAYYGYIHIFKRLGLDQYFVEQTSEEKI
jgi:prepilin-type N-terminal cleavage/methylation domain-containing protein